MGLTSLQEDKYVLICPLTLRGLCDSTGFRSLQQLGHHLRTGCTKKATKTLYANSSYADSLHAHEKLLDFCREKKYMSDKRNACMLREGVGALHLVRFTSQYKLFRANGIPADALEVIPAEDVM